MQLSVLNMPEMVIAYHT